MRNYFHERWKTDVGSADPSGSQIDVPLVLARWASDPESWAAARNLKPMECREILSGLGRMTYDKDAGRFKTELLWNTRKLHDLWSDRERDRMLRRHTELLFASFSDNVTLATTGEREKALAEVGLVGKRHLTAAQATGRGVILFGAYQSNPRFLLDQPFLAGRTIGVIRHAGSSMVPAFLFADAPPNVRLLPDSVRAVRSILELLSRGQMVAYYNDFLYSGPAGAMSTLFGRPVLIARAILSIALKTRSTILPVAIVRTGSPGRERVVVEVFRPIDLQAVNWSHPRDPNLMALMIGVATECLIRRHPPDWRLWNTLECRWKQAEVYQSRSRG